MREFLIRGLRRAPIIQDLWHEYERMLAARAMALAERDAALAERSTALAERDVAIVERDAALADLAPYERVKSSKQLIDFSLFRSEAKEFNNIDERLARYEAHGVVFEIKQHERYPHTYIDVRLHDKPEHNFNEMLYYSHHGLAAFVTKFNADWESVLDIGSRNGTSARLFEFLDKDVVTIEPVAAFTANANAEFCDYDFDRQFDAIWCSHVLEHQRNAGRFIDKIFETLKEGGILAITVPYVTNKLVTGHCNVYTPLLLIYNLILAGFDCSGAAINTYDWQFSVILKKISIDIPRNPLSNQIASTFYDDETAELTIKDLLKYFPTEIPPYGVAWGEIDKLNW